MNIPDREKTLQKASQLRIVEGMTWKRIALELGLGERWQTLKLATEKKYGRLFPKKRKLNGLKIGRPRKNIAL